MPSISDISFLDQDQIQNEFHQYVQISPLDDFSRDLILTHNYQRSQLLFYPPLKCFPDHQAVDGKRWKPLSLCCAYSLFFFNQHTKSTPKNQNLYRLSKMLLVESQRICGSIFDLTDPFWQSFYRHMTRYHAYHPILQSEDQETALLDSHLSIFLLPLHVLNSSMRLSTFQMEMLEQSLLAMFKGFYNMEKKGIPYQRRLFREALTFAKDLPLVGFDRWINHYAHLIIISKNKNA